MKLCRIIILLLLIQPLSSPIYSQSLRNVELNQHIDSLSIFPAIGVIKCPQGGKVLPSDSLNVIYLANLKRVLPTTSSFKINYLGSELDLSDSLKIYLVKTITKFSHLSEETFSVIPIGLSFNKMIEKLPGRYFGIIFYEGFVQYNLEEKIGTSIAFALAQSALTGRLFLPISFPKGPHLINDILIIDKESNRFYFYRRQFSDGSPLDSGKIRKIYTKFFRKL